MNDAHIKAKMIEITDGYNEWGKEDVSDIIQAFIRLD